MRSVQMNLISWLGPRWTCSLEQFHWSWFERLARIWADTVYLQVSAIIPAGCIPLQLITIEGDLLCLSWSWLLTNELITMDHFMSADCIYLSGLRSHSSLMYLGGLWLFGLIWILHTECTYLFVFNLFSKHPNHWHKNCFILFTFRFYRFSLFSFFFFISRVLLTKPRRWVLNYFPSVEPRVPSASW